MDLFFGAYWRRLQSVRKGALRSGTAADNPDRRRVWLQHSLSPMVRREGELCESAELEFLWLFKLFYFELISPQGFHWRALLADEKFSVTSIDACVEMVSVFRSRRLLMGYLSPLHLLRTVGQWAVGRLEAGWTTCLRNSNRTASAEAEDSKTTNGYDISDNVVSLCQC